MNYLAHAYRFLGDPFFVAGTALPDWMNVIDRKNRARRQHAETLLLHDPDPEIASFARGCVQHHDDDHWFHGLPEFVLLSTQFAVEVRPMLSEGLGHQAGFLGHIVVELLMDSVLIEDDPRRLEEYYMNLSALEPERIQFAANQICQKPVTLLQVLIPRFVQERFLADYVDDHALFFSAEPSHAPCSTTTAAGHHCRMDAISQSSRKVCYGSAAATYQSSSELRRLLACQPLSNTESAMYPARSNDAARITTRGCLIYGVVLFIGIPVVLAIVAALFLFAREKSARQRLNARVATIRAQGLPVDNASMATYHKALSSADNTQAWLAALEELRANAFAQSIQGVPIFDGQLDDSSLPIPGDLWKEEQATRQFLTQWDALHRQISVLSRQQLQAGVRPVRFPIKFDSLNTVLNATQEMRSAARLLMLRGQVAVFDGDSTATCESIEALLGNSLALSGQPILISQLVSLAIDGMALDLLKKALEFDVLALDDLRKLRGIVLEKTEIGPQWHYAMHGERALVLPVFLDPSVASGALPVNVAILPPGRSHDALNYLDHIDGVLNVPVEDFDDFMAGLEIEEAKLVQISSGGLLARMDSLLTGMMTPATSAAGKAFVRQATMHRLAALAIGVREFEKELGAPPSTLTELQDLGINSAELSPPGKKPFGYSTNTEESVIWGFDLNTEHATPDMPPTVDPAKPNADQRSMWIWRMPKSGSHADN